MEKKWKGQDERSGTAQAKGHCKTGDELVEKKKKANQPKSKINLQKHGGVPVKREREII